MGRIGSAGAVRAIDGVLSLSHPAQPHPRPPDRQRPPHLRQPSKSHQLTQCCRTAFTPPVSFRALHMLLSHSLYFLIINPHFLSHCYEYKSSSFSTHSSAALPLLKTPSQPPSFPAPCYHPTEKLIARSILRHWKYFLPSFLRKISSASSSVHPEPDNIFKHETHSPLLPDSQCRGFHVRSEQNKFKINSCAQAGYPLMQALQPLSP